MNNYKTFSTQTPQSINHKYFYQTYNLGSLSEDDNNPISIFKAIVQTNSPLKGVEDLSLTRNILTLIKNDFYQSKNEERFKTLKTSLNKIAKDYKKYLNLSFFIICANTCYISALGKISVLLFRNGNLYTLLRGSESPLLMSGKVFDNDIFVIVSSSLLAKMSKSEINSKLTTSDLNLLPNHIVTKAQNEQDWKDIFAVAINVYRLKTENIEKVKVKNEISNQAKFPV